MNIRFRRFIAAALLAAVASAVSSCGKKADPLTPDSPRPEAVRITKATVRDNVAFLSWPIPTRNVEGKDMSPDKVGRFLVYRAEVGQEKKRLRYREIAVIEMPSPSQAEVVGGTVLWKDQNLKYGQVYVYRVRAESIHGASGPYSEEVRVAPLLTVSQPRNLVAVLGDGQVNLTWDAVTTKTDGSKHEGFVGYNVYRGTAAGRREDKPLNSEPLRTTSYRDTAVVNGKTYYYSVRAVDSPVLPWRESLDSAEASATPKDMTPPAKPSGLTVVPGVGRIFLTWNENKEADVAGYNVYRSVKSGRDYEKLTEKPIKRTTFSDETVKPGTMYYYVVTAVDEAGNESAHSKELRATAERVR
jgi:fibronectin type 3 domain-containing protein